MKSYFEKLSLKLKLLSWAIGSMFLLFMILIGQSLQNQRQSLVHATKVASLAEARTAEKQITKRINSAFSVAKSLAELFKVSKKEGSGVKFTRESADEVLKAALLANKDVLGVWTAWEPNAFDGKDEAYKGTSTSDKSGRYIPYWTRNTAGEPNFEVLVSYDVPGEGDYYQLPKKELKEVILEPYMYLVQGKDTLITSLSVPIIVEGQFVGVVGVDLSLAFFQELVNGIDVVDGKGSVIVFSNSGVTSAFAKDASQINVNYAEIKKDGYLNLDPARFTAESSVQIDDENITTVMPIFFGAAEKPWYIEVIVPASHVSNSIWEALFWGIIESAVAAFIFLLIGYTIVNSICNRLINIATSLKNTAQNTEINSSSIEEASTAVSTSTIQQAAAIQESVASLEQISSMVKRGLEFADKSSTVAIDSHTSAEQGNLAVKNIIRKIEEVDDCNKGLAARIEQSNTELNSIIEIFNEISTKTAVINDIVFQTRLLSFNASVEAARAGEQGKGFAVVAEEVGSLAQMSGDAAAEISTLLTNSVTLVEDIIEKTKSSVQQMVQIGSEKASESVDAAKETGKVLAELLDKVGEVKKMMTQIQEASSEQSQGIDNISEAMKTLNDTTYSNQTNVEKNKKFSKKMTVETDSLKGAVVGLEKEVFGIKKKAA